MGTLLSLWNGGNEPSKSDDTFFKGYVGTKERKGEGSVCGRKTRGLGRVGQKKGGSLGVQPQYRQKMAETYGRTTKDNVFAEGQLVLKVPH